jgi:hypothetical protein
MKKLSLLVLLSAVLVFLAQPCFSQRSIFVTGGVLTSWITGEHSWSTGLIGGQVGVGMHIANLNERIGFRGELNYSLQGSNWDETETSGHTSMSYLNIPLVLRYQWASGLFGELGVQPGFLLSAKDHWEGGSEDAKEWLNSFDFGIPVGVGYEFKGNFGVGLRYIMGVTNVLSDSSEGSDHNNVLVLRLTYTFNKK